MLSIYNAALAKLGSNRLEQVLDADEPGAVGGLCRLLLPQVLELALDYAPWSFALSRATLTADAQNPGGGRYPFGLALPGDLVRPVSLHAQGAGAEDPGLPFAVEGRRLLSPVPKAELLYVRREDDPALWTAPFSQAVILGLAAELCPAVLNDVARQEFYQQAFQAALAHAAAADLKRQKFRPRPADWLTSRA